MAKRQIELTVKLKLPEKLEQHLTYLEEVSKRSKDFIIQEALIQYLEDAEDMSRANEIERKKGNKSYTMEELLEEINLKNNKKEEKEKIIVELPKSWVNHLEHLEKTTKKSKDYYIRECLGRYLENAHELQIALERIKSNSKTYSGEKANERLKELRAKNS